MLALYVDGAVARLTLSRPNARNAIPFAGWKALAEAVREIAASARVMILSGEPGGVFCAGADVSEFTAFAGDIEARSQFRRAMRHALDVLRDLPIPTIALIEGDCYGAGVAMAMACDIRIASAGAMFAITPAKFGISYPQEDIHHLVALVGPGQAARLLLSGESIGAAEAKRIGLVEFTVAKGSIRTVSEFAATIAANDADSLKTLKAGLRLAVSGVAHDEWQDRVFDDLLGSEALFERLAAHRARRR
jgi:enoyl-CoA hydratase/carnithine racemase